MEARQPYCDKGALVWVGYVYKGRETINKKRGKGYHWAAKRAKVCGLSGLRWFSLLCRIFVPAPLPVVLPGSKKVRILKLGLGF